MASNTTVIKWNNDQWTCASANLYARFYRLFEEIIDILVFFRVKVHYSHDRHEYLTTAYFPMELRFCLVQLWQSRFSSVAPSRFLAIADSRAAQTAVRQFCHIIFNNRHHPVNDKEYWRLQVSPAVRPYLLKLISIQGACHRFTEVVKDIERLQADPPPNSARTILSRSYKSRKPSLLSTSSKLPPTSINTTTEGKSLDKYEQSRALSGPSNESWQLQLELVAFLLGKRMHSNSTHEQNEPSTNAKSQLNFEQSIPVSKLLNDTSIAIPQLLVTPSTSPRRTRESSACRPPSHRIRRYL